MCEILYKLYKGLSDVLLIVLSARSIRTRLVECHSIHGGGKVCENLVSDDMANVKPVPLPYNKLEQTRLLFGLHNPFRPLAIHLSR